MNNDNLSNNNLNGQNVNNAELLSNTISMPPVENNVAVNDVPVQMPPQVIVPTDLQVGDVPVQMPPQANVSSSLQVGDVPVQMPPQADGVQTNQISDASTNNVTHTPPVFEEKKEELKLGIIEARNAAKERAAKELELRRQEIEKNYKPIGKFRSFLLFVFFVLMIGFALFLPEISNLIARYKDGTLNVKSEKIVDGSLKCTLTSDTANLTKEYTRVFYFTGNQLDKSDYTIITKGDAGLDGETLDKMNNNCLALSDGLKNISGVNISCKLTSNSLTEKQSFVYEVIDKNQFDAILDRFDHNILVYNDKADMDQIEKNMNASGYSCERSK